MSGDGWLDLRTVSEICQARRRILSAAMTPMPGHGRSTIAASGLTAADQARYLMRTAEYDQAERELRQRLGYLS